MSRLLITPAHQISFLILSPPLFCFLRNLEYAYHDRFLSLGSYYYRNANSTHYYRINLTDAKSKKSKKVKIDFTELNSLLNLAAERKADQE